jgi:dipeptidyl aminopeptidase/acylaminoacyl peptidase
LFAAKDYFVVLINPHGSTGQGQDYQDAVRNNWLFLIFVF